MKNLCFMLEPGMKITIASATSVMDWMVISKTIRKNTMGCTMPAVAAASLMDAAPAAISFYRTDSTTASSATPAADKPAAVLTTATTRNVKPPVIRNNLTTQLKLPQRLTKHTFVYVLATTYIQYRISYKDPLPQAERVL